MHTQHHDAQVLLRTEHAVARVLTEACDEATAFPRLLAAIGESLGWDAGALWKETDAVSRRAVLRRDLARARAVRADHPEHAAGARARAARQGVGERGAGMGRRRGRRRELPAWPERGRGGSARGVLLPDPRRDGRARSGRVPRRRAARARRQPARDDDQPRQSHRPVRGALAGGGPPARERRAQERDPQRRLRLRSSRWTPMAASSRSTRPRSGCSATSRARWSGATWPS